MAKKLLVPDANNREACLTQIWDKLYLTCEPSPLLKGIYLDFSTYLSHRRHAQVVASLFHVSTKELNRAIALRHAGDLSLSSELMKKGFAYAYWGRELDACVRVVDAWEPDQGDGDIHEEVAWQALSIVCGSPWFALWLAPHLHNQFGYPSDDISLIGYSLDQPARQFMEMLQSSLVTGQWPGQIDVAKLGGYGGLLTALPHPQRWHEALVAFCDWRVANAYGYAEMGASKRRRQSAGYSALDRESWEQVFPIELFILQFAYERATGQRVSLQADHPMLQSPLMTAPFPELEPMYDDEWLQRTRQLHAETFGSRFGLRQTIASLYI